MMRFVVIDNCPVPSKAAPFVAEARRRSGVTLNSCFRGIEARDLLKKLGKHDQAYLYWGWLHHLPGFNPANPPGFSSHECRCDGVFPPGYSRGAKIPEELVGTDWANGFAVLQTYRAMGVPAVMPYSSSSERQHVDISQVPKSMPLLKRGEKGKDVVRLKHQLAFIERPKKQGRYYGDDRKDYFGRILERAVKLYQSDHGLVADGIVGPQTQAQIDYSFAYWKKRRHDAQDPKDPKDPKHPVKAYKGIDVSNNNGDVDWMAVRRGGILIAGVRCTEGLSGHGSEDEYFTSGRVKAIRQAGVIPCYYHFAHPQPGRTPESEAHHFFNYVKARGGWDIPVFLPPALDAEWVSSLGTSDLVKWYKGFLKELRALLMKEIDGSRADEIRAVTGLDPRVPIIYTGGWFWNPRTGDSKDFDRYPLWYSYYTSSAQMPHVLPRSWQKKGVTMLQHSDKGAVSGVRGHVDLNIFYGYIDQKRLAALL